MKRIEQESSSPIENSTSINENARKEQTETPAFPVIFRQRVMNKEKANELPTSIENSSSNEVQRTEDRISTIVSFS